ncbi:hypothetical protein N7495_007187 [Penicillium taxi]|uniref:uncharacterized protein n=1 Tax=Penicillium taxi TaxID=168475 RepID=UPI0025458397|nr:uncharacterized protein N7495_007187 [Penicillium taxi]KAJ5895496.1 hypothetical protein N7495_007187 [Penicillium taxi]
MLGEAHHFFEILKWAENTTAALPADISKGLSHPVGNPLSVSVAIPLGARGPIEAKEHTIRLTLAFRNAVISHCSENGLDVARAFPPKVWQRYFNVTRSKFRLQLEQFARPLAFPITLCRLSPEEAGYNAWHTAIKE